MSDDKKQTRRKKHRNSKLGCATCKRRRVKCDEQLPLCGNCIKHRSTCDYTTFTTQQLDDFRRAKAQAEKEATLKLQGDAAPELPVQLEDLSLGDDVRHRERAEAGSAAAPLEPLEPLDTLDTLDAQLDEYATPFDENMRELVSEWGTLYPSLPAIDEHAESELHEHQRRAPGGVHDVLNFQPNAAITKNFDNLLAGDNGDNKIIYPVYLFNNTPGEEEWDEYAARDERPRGPTGLFALDRDVFRLPFQPPLAPPANALPGASVHGRTFSVTPRQKINYEELLFSVIAQLGKDIATGRATLPQIRRLYHVWLGFFTYRAFRSEVMFLCLTNLTTNYLITNVFLAPGTGHFGDLVLVTQLRNTLIMHLVQHYATVIKGLRSLLNYNADPEMAALVSYILSLMAIYDPGATPFSTKCFRDGMFSVLSYTLSISKKKGVPPPLLVPIHLQLMTNVARTVYLPAYKATFLEEYELMFNRLGAVLRILEPQYVTNKATAQFISKAFANLDRFCLETLKSHIPNINSNLGDIEYQEEILFNMLRLWAEFMPARLLMVKTSTDPIEKVVNLFYRLFRKAVFAVVPQVRFFYLRDFDLPLMLDVFTNNNDTDVFAELSNPENLCILPEAYAQVVDELRLLAGYAIRLITFFTMRLSILYRNLVYNDTVRLLYPIHNVVDWRKSVSNIDINRDDFHDRVGLTEYPIEQFNTTYITNLHYPQIVYPNSPGARLATPQPPENDADGLVDLLLVQHYGLLQKDVLPPLLG